MWVHKKLASAADWTKQARRRKPTLVEDAEAAVREISQTCSEAYSYPVLTATDEIEAIALTCNIYLHAMERRDCVSLVDMPPMGGILPQMLKNQPQIGRIAAYGGWLLTF